MNRIKTVSEVKVYEVDGSSDFKDKPTLFVHSHWNRNRWVRLKIGDQDVTVIKQDLIKAIENATNV